MKRSGLKSKLRYSIIYIIILAFSLAGCSHESKYTILIDNVTGLQKGSEVLLKGIPVGEVSEMEMLDNSLIAVTISLKKGIKLPIGSTFELQTPLIGDSKLILERSNSSILAVKHDTLRGYFDTTSSMNLFLDSTKNKRVRKALKKIVEGFGELFDSTMVDSTGN